MYCKIDVCIYIEQLDYQKMDVHIPPESICYELTRIPTLSFKGFEDLKKQKIEQYITNKILEINHYEKLYYEEIMELIWYDYRYHFKFLIEYQDYYDLINSLTNFDPSRDILTSLPTYLNTTRLIRLRKNAKRIRHVLDMIKQIREKKLTELKNFSKKNKFYINCTIMPNT